jgi:hypothetical protein
MAAILPVIAVSCQRHPVQVLHHIVLYVCTQYAVAMTRWSGNSVCVYCETLAIDAILVPSLGSFPPLQRGGSTGPGYSTTVQPQRVDD